jgi:hypothetical protein
MTPDAQILAPPASPGESTDPRRWLTLVILLLAALTEASYLRSRVLSTPRTTPEALLCRGLRH